MSKNSTLINNEMSELSNKVDNQSGKFRSNEEPFVHFYFAVVITLMIIIAFKRTLNDNEDYLEMEAYRT